MDTTETVNNPVSGNGDDGDDEENKGGAVADVEAGYAGLTHYEQFVSKVDGMVPLEVQNPDTGKPAMKTTPTVLIAIVCLGSFGYGFGHTSWSYFFGNCSESNGCVTCNIIDKYTDDELTKCSAAVAPALSINAGCLSFGIRNNYAEIDKCVGKSAFQSHGWGAGWESSGNATQDIFHESLAAHREIWNCFKPTDLGMVQDPDVDCVRTWTRKYHGGLSDQLYSCSAALGCTFNGKKSRVTDSAMKAFGIKMFNSLFTISSALASSEKYWGDYSEPDGCGGQTNPCDGGGDGGGDGGDGGGDGGAGGGGRPMMLPVVPVVSIEPLSSVLARSALVKSMVLSPPNSSSIAKLGNADSLESLKSAFVRLALAKPILVSPVRLLAVSDEPLRLAFAR